jgi:tRNA pseudouridine55 synthase
LIGFVVVDKEAGWTSHDVVARTRRLLGERRVGHAGTLDPGATGVLVLGVGRATRLLGLLSGADKAYRGEVVLGSSTTTLDDAGEVVARFEMDAVTLEDVQRAAQGLLGEIDQQVPMVSAVKVGGRRLHRLAREGLEVERPVRRVRVDRFAVGPGAEPGVFAIEVVCSAGTYVRALADDLGKALGGGAHLRRLRRTRSGTFTEADARPLSAIEDALAQGEDVLRRPLEALGLPVVVVAGPLEVAVRHGRPVERGVLGVEADGPFALSDGDGQLLAVYAVGSGEPLAKPSVVLVAG